MMPVCCHHKPFDTSCECCNSAVTASVIAQDLSFGIGMLKAMLPGLMVAQKDVAQQIIDKLDEARERANQIRRAL